MVLDVLIAFIVIYAMAFGFRAGFVYTFLHTIGWIVAIVLAFVWSPKAKELIEENTGVYDAIQRAVAEKFADAAEAGRFAEALPGMIANSVITDFLFTVTAFLAAMFVIKLALYALIRLLSKKYHRGFRGVIDGFLGLLIGFVKGIFVVFILLAVMIPALTVIDSASASVVLGWLDSSNYARTLYDSNIFVLIVRDFLM